LNCHMLLLHISAESQVSKESQRSVEKNLDASAMEARAVSSSCPLAKVFGVSPKRSNGCANLDDEFQQQYRFRDSLTGELVTILCVLKYQSHSGSAYTARAFERGQQRWRRIQHEGFDTHSSATS